MARPTSVTLDDASMARWAELADAWTAGNRTRALALALAIAGPLVPSIVAELGRVPDADAAADWAARPSRARPDEPRQLPVTGR
jgi:hypothetical protein